MQRLESPRENAGYSITVGFTVARAEKLHLMSPCINKVVAVGRVNADPAVTAQPGLESYETSPALG